MNLPNKLTVARCVLALVFVILMSVESMATYLAAYALFFVAAATDYYDGRIARERGIITNFGKLLDPVADKVLMLSAYITLMRIEALMVPAWTVVVILAREFLVTGARSLAAAEGAVLSANQWGKAKTAVQMVYVITFLTAAVFFQMLRTWPAIRELLPGGADLYVGTIAWASMIGIVAVAVYTVFSGIQFAYSNWEALNLGEEV